jgi:hypothetical protein
VKARVSSVLLSLASPLRTEARSCRWTYSSSRSDLGCGHVFTVSLYTLVTIFGCVNPVSAVVQPAPATFATFCLRLRVSQSAFVFSDEWESCVCT